MLRVLHELISPLHSHAFAGGSSGTCSKHHNRITPVHAKTMACLACRAILALPSQPLMCTCAECGKLPESSLRTFLCQVSQLRSLDLSGVPSARTEVLLEVIACPVLPGLAVGEPAPATRLAVRDTR